MEEGSGWKDSCTQRQGERDDSSLDKEDFSSFNKIIMPDRDYRW